MPVPGKTVLKMWGKRKRGYSISPIKANVRKFLIKMVEVKKQIAIGLVAPYRSNQIKARLPWLPNEKTRKKVL